MPTLRRRQLLHLAVAAPLAFTAAAHAAAPRVIDERGYVRINGIEQWIDIHSGDLARPAVLVLHGGPGAANSLMLDLQEAWRRRFTLVNWDQRGAGRTFARHGNGTPGMGSPAEALATLVADAIAVARHARTRLGERPLLLVGHSWGAALGLHVLREAPRLFSQFVATGQPVNLSRSRELRAGAPLPPQDREYLQWQARLLRDADAATAGGSAFSEAKLGAVLRDFDALAEFPRLEVPYLLIQGRADNITSTLLAREYLAGLSAPQKDYVSLDGGHFGCFTSGDAFPAAIESHLQHLPRQRR
jgi:pimeloyl-ACP methyl ester carboxylesterase